MSGFTVFSGLSATVRSSYTVPATNPWAGSPFEWISDAQSGRKGAVGKHLVRVWAEGEGLQVSRNRGAVTISVLAGSASR